MSGIRPRIGFISGGGSGVGSAVPSIPAIANLWALYNDQGLPETGAIAQWSDTSGNTRHIAQATPASRPSVATFGPFGLKAALFDGASTYFLSRAELLPEIFSYLYVYRAAANTRQVPFGDFQSAPGSSGFYFDQNEPINSVFGRQFVTYNNFATGNSQTQVRYCAARQSGITSTMYFGGAFNPPTFVGSAYVAPSTAEFRIGSRNDGSILAMHGRICELAIYNRALTDDELIQLASYATAKWGAV